MKRIDVAPRGDWQRQVEALGFVTHTPDAPGQTYWNESACWVFSEAEIDALEQGTAELHRMCLQAVEHVVSNPAMLHRFGVPEFTHRLIAESWRRANPMGVGDPTLMGRFDLAFDGRDIKMIEYNADCPATLVETSIVQWDWLKQVMPDVAAEERQFNIVHDYLVEHLTKLRAMTGGAMLHFASEKPIVEEHVQIEYMREIAQEAGFTTDHLDMGEIGIERGNGAVRLVDMQMREIRFLYKMYPWEWLFREEIGASLHALSERVGFIEPMWKVILSSKAILPIMWSLFPDHPMLLPAYFEPHASLGGNFASKPVVGWEGKGVEIVQNGAVVDANDAGPFGDEPRVYQALADLQVAHGRFTQIGSWVVGDRPGGILVRENDRPLIKTASDILPHYWE